MSRKWVVEALDRYERPLVGYARRLLGDREAARDVVQDTFLRLCQQRPEQLDGHLKEWLFTVCRNRAVDRLRKEARMDLLDATELEGGGAQPAARLEKREQESRLLACIDSLPRRQQEVLRLKFQEGLSYKQISAATEESVGNVGFLLHTAIQALRARLDPAANQRTAS